MNRRPAELLDFVPAAKCPGVLGIGRPSVQALALCMTACAHLPLWAQNGDVYTETLASSAAQAPIPPLSPTLSPAPAPAAQIGPRNAPLQVESLRSFLDSRAEASALSDKEGAKATPTGERLVRLYGPLNGFYSSSVPSVIGARSNQLGAAGSRDTRTGLRMGDPWRAPGLFQLSQRKLDTLRDTEAAFEWVDRRNSGAPAPQPAVSGFTGFNWRASLSQSEQEEVQRREAAVRVHANLSDTTVFGLGLSARQWQVPVGQQFERASVAQAGLAWAAENGGAQANLSIEHPFSKERGSAGAVEKMDSTANSVLKLAASMQISADWTAYASATSATNAAGLLLTDAMRVEEAWRARLGVHWAYKGSVLEGSNNSANNGPNNAAAIYTELRSGTLANGGDQGIAMGWRDAYSLNANWRLSTFAEVARLLGGTAPFDGVRGGVGLQRDFDGHSQLETTVELAQGDVGKSQRLTGKYTVKVSSQSVLALRASTAIAERVSSLLTPTGRESQLAQVKAYWVWRAPAGAFVSVAIAAYTDEKLLRPDPAHQRVWVLSEQVRYTPRFAREAAGSAEARSLLTPSELAVRVAVRQLDNVPTRQVTSSQMLLGRASWRVAPLWQLSGHAATVAGALGPERYALGAEASYQMGRVVDLAFGYNLRGFHDADLQAEDRLTPGAYVRLRFEFDKALARWYR